MAEEEEEDHHQDHQEEEEEEMDFSTEGLVLQHTHTHTARRKKRRSPTTASTTTIHAATSATSSATATATTTATTTSLRSEVQRGHATLRALLRAELDLDAVSPDAAERLLEQAHGGGDPSGDDDYDDGDEMGASSSDGGEDEPASASVDAQYRQLARQEAQHAAALRRRWAAAVESVGARATRTPAALARFLARLRLAAHTVVTAECALREHEEDLQQQQQQGEEEEGTARLEPFWVVVNDNGGRRAPSSLDLRVLVLWMLQTLDAVGKRRGDRELQDDDDEEEEEEDLEEGEQEKLSAGGAAAEMVSSRHNAVNIATTYLALLQINGVFGAANLFHPHLYRSILSLVNTWSGYMMHGADDKSRGDDDKREHISSRDALQLCMLLKRLLGIEGASVGADGLDDEEEDDGDVDMDADTDTATQQQEQQQRATGHSVLSAAPHSMADTIECLCEVTRSAQVRARGTCKCSAAAGGRGRRRQQLVHMCEHTASTQIFARILAQAWRALEVLASDRDPAAMDNHDQTATTTATALAQHESRHMPALAKYLLPSLLLSYSHTNTEAALVCAGRTTRFLRTHGNDYTLITLAQQLIVFGGGAAAQRASAAPSATNQKHILGFVAELLCGASKRRHSSAIEKAVRRVDAFAPFLLRASRNKEPRVRAFAVDAAVHLEVHLRGALPDGHPRAAADSLDTSSSLFGGACLARTSDKNATVRTHAITACTQLLTQLREETLSGDGDERDESESLGPSAAVIEPTENLEGAAPVSSRVQSGEHQLVHPTALVTALLRCAFRRLDDDKGSVRAAALRLCQQFLVAPGDLLSARDIGAFLRRVCANAGDSQITVRKLVVTVATGLMRLAPARSQNDYVEVAKQYLGVASTTLPIASAGPAAPLANVDLAWIRAIVPMCMDAEPTVAQTAAIAVVQALVDPFAQTIDDGNAVAQIRALVLWAHCEAETGSIVDRHVRPALRLAVRARPERSTDLFFALQALGSKLRELHQTQETVIEPTLGYVGCSVAISVLLDHLRESKTQLGQALMEEVSAEWELVKRLSANITPVGDGMSSQIVLSERNQRFIARFFRAASSRISAAARSKSRGSVESKWADSLCADLFTTLRDALDGRRECALTTIQELVRTCVHFHDRITAIDDTPANIAGAARVQSWARKLLETCERQLSDVIFDVGREDQHFRDTSTAGEDIGLAAGVTDLPIEQVTLITSWVATIGELVVLSNETHAARVKKGSAPLKRGEAKLVPRLSPSERTTTCLQTMMDSDGPLSKRIVPQRFAKLRSLAFLVMGKVCLFDSALARACVPFIATNVLSEDGDSAIRTNAICVLGDLCLRFTNLCEKHLVHEVAVCAMSDPVPQVRASALSCIFSVLAQGYMKLNSHNGKLFQCLCVCLCDPEPTIARLCARQLSDILRNPTSTAHGARMLPGGASSRTNTEGPRGAHSSNAPFVVSQVVNLVFALNGNTDHPEHGQENGSMVLAMQRRLAAGWAPPTHLQHKTIFRFLLRLLSDETRLHVQSLVVSHGICSFVEESMSLERFGGGAEVKEHVHASPCVLVDAMQLLRLPEMNTKGTDAHLIPSASDPIDSSIAEAKQARNALLSAVAAKATMETIVPALVQIREMSRRNRLPLQRDACLTLACVCGLESRKLNAGHDVGPANFSRMKELLCFVVGDTQLLDEIAFDVCAAVAEAEPQQEQQQQQQEQQQQPDDGQRGLSNDSGVDVDMQDGEIRVAAEEETRESKSLLSLGGVGSGRAPSSPEHLVRTEQIVDDSHAPPSAKVPKAPILDGAITAPEPEFEFSGDGEITDASRSQSATPTTAKAPAHATGEEATNTETGSAKKSGARASPRRGRSGSRRNSGGVAKKPVRGLSLGARSRGGDGRSRRDKVATDDGDSLAESAHGSTSLSLGGLAKENVDEEKVTVKPAEGKITSSRGRKRPPPENSKAKDGKARSRSGLSLGGSRSTTSTKRAKN